MRSWLWGCEGLAEGSGSLIGTCGGIANTGGPPLNRIIVTPPGLGTITVTGTGGEGTGVLIQATNSAVVNITAP